MRCPRCDGPLTTFVLKSADQSAVVCESCGFAGVPASHHPEELDAESWEQALERFERVLWSADQSCETTRTATVPLPGAAERSELTFDELEASVPGVASIRNDQANDDRPVDDHSERDDEGEN